MKYYIVDAFAEELFKGNQAGICVLDKWIDDNLMQNIASENNLAETAFVVKTDNGYDLRWFTPNVEIDLCGHATLNSGYDFVSRFFAPNAGINEDPVTGSSHSTLIPFWAERLNKSKLAAKQLSKRGGTLFCENNGNRVKISGKAKLYLEGEIKI